MLLPARVVPHDIRTHVDPALITVVVRDGVSTVRDPAGLPEVRAIDHGKLETFRAVNGQDLHRFGVGLESPTAFLVEGVGGCFAYTSAEPCGQRRYAESLPARGRVE